MLPEADRGQYSSSFGDNIHHLLAQHPSSLRYYCSRQCNRVRSSRGFSIIPQYPAPSARDSAPQDGKGLAEVPWSSPLIIRPWDGAPWLQLRLFPDLFSPGWTPRAAPEPVPSLCVHRAAGSHGDLVPTPAPGTQFPDCDSANVLGSLLELLPGWQSPSPGLGCGCPALSHTTSWPHGQLDSPSLPFLSNFPRI